MAYKILLNFKMTPLFDDDYEDFTAYLTGSTFRKHSAVGFDGHEQSTLDISFKADNAIFSRFLEQKKNIIAKVLKDDEPYFYGIIRPDNSFEIYENLREFKVQIVDETWRLDRNSTIPNTLEYTDIKVCDNSNKSNSALHRLAAAGGLGLPDINVYRGDVIPKLVISPDTKIGDIFDKICEEYALSYSFDNAGKLVITDLAPEEIVPQITLNNSNLLQPLSITKNDNDNDGASVSWAELVELKDKLIYRDIADAEDRKCITKGLYYPANGNAVPAYQTYKYESDTLKFVSSKNHRLVCSFDTGIEITRQDFLSDKAQILFHNTSTTTDLYLNNFDIRADIICSQNRKAVFIYGNKEESVDADWIFTKASASKLCRFLVSKQKYSNYEISFSSKSVFPVGTCAKLIENQTGLEMTVFITSRDEEENNPIISYTAVSVSPLSVIGENSIKEEMTSSSASSSEVSKDDISEVVDRVEVVETEQSTQAQELKEASDKLVAQAQELASHAQEIVDINSDISSLTGNVSTITNRITTAEGNITTNTSAIAQNATDITSIATRVSTAEGTLVSHGTSINQNATDITSIATRVLTAEGKITSNTTQINQNADEISSVATSLTNLEGTVETQGTSITQNANGITSLATRVSTAENTITTQGSSITQNADNITSLVSRVSTAEGNISTNTSQISQNADNIALKVSAVDTGGNAVANAKLEIGTADGAGYIKLDANKILIDGSVKANKIDVDDLAAQSIKLNGENGEIKSSNFVWTDTAQQGFKVSADGILYAKSAYLNNAQINSTDSKGTLFKTQYGSTGTVLHCSAKSRWDIMDLFTALGSDYSTGTATYDGITYDFTITRNAVINILKNQSLKNFSYTTKIPGKLSISSSNDRYEPCYVSYRGQQVVIFGDGGSNSFILEKDETISIDNRGTGSVSYFFRTSQTNQWFLLLHKTENGLAYPYFSFEIVNSAFSKSLVVDGVFNSSNSITLAPITGWYDDIAELNKPIPCDTATSLITVDGTPYNVSYVIKQSNSLAFTMTNGTTKTLSAPVDNTEGSTTGWHNITGDIVFVSEQRGLITESIFPSNATRTLGSVSEKWQEIYGNVIYGNVNSLGTTNKVWGAVAN